MPGPVAEPLIGSGGPVPTGIRGTLLGAARLGSGQVGTGRVGPAMLGSAASGRVRVRSAVIALPRVRHRIGNVLPRGAVPARDRLGTWTERRLRRRGWWTTGKRPSRLLGTGSRRRRLRTSPRRRMLRAGTRAGLRRADTRCGALYARAPAGTVPSVGRRVHLGRRLRAGSLRAGARRPVRSPGGWRWRFAALGTNGGTFFLGGPQIGDPAEFLATDLRLVRGGLRTLAPRPPKPLES